MPKALRVRVEQTGTAHGEFDCPACDTTAQYKFAAASGFCGGCGTTFVRADGTEIHDMESGSRWVDLEIDYSRV